MASSYFARSSVNLPPMCARCARVVSQQRLCAFSYRADPRLATQWRRDIIKVTDVCGHERSINSFVFYARRSSSLVFCPFSGPRHGLDLILARKALRQSLTTEANMRLFRKIIEWQLWAEKRERGELTSEQNNFFSLPRSFVLIAFLGLSSRCAGALSLLDENGYTWEKK